MADRHPSGRPAKRRRLFPWTDPAARTRRARIYQSTDAPKENLVNTTIETYFQDPPSSCMSCHQSLSNALGRDFVAFSAVFAEAVASAAHWACEMSFASRMMNLPPSRVKSIVSPGRKSRLTSGVRTRNIISIAGMQPIMSLWASVEPAGSRLDRLDEATTVKDALGPGFLNLGGVAGRQSADNEGERKPQPSELHYRLPLHALSTLYGSSASTSARPTSSTGSTIKRAPTRSRSRSS